MCNVNTKLVYLQIHQVVGVLQSHRCKYESIENYSKTSLRRISVDCRNSFLFNRVRTNEVLLYSYHIYFLICDVGKIPRPP